uniref:uncharacterized protein LOC105350351 n=1 Tax=Fragaria vesca subsp. vesca TaxID=101020 RepID=UPI0005CAA027|nr:PREDICTED: uncharacterized protein LOC105350351 [Fragaria vesca subsp. vesca]
MSDRNLATWNAYMSNLVLDWWPEKFIQLVRQGWEPIRLLISQCLFRYVGFWDLGDSYVVCTEGSSSAALIAYAKPRSLGLFLMFCKRVFWSTQNRNNGSVPTAVGFKLIRSRIGGFTVARTQRSNGFSSLGAKTPIKMTQWRRLQWRLVAVVENVKTWYGSGLAKGWFMPVSGHRLSLKVATKDPVSTGKEERIDDDGGVVKGEI